MKGSTQLTSFPLCQKSRDIEEKSSYIKRRQVRFSTRRLTMTQISIVNDARRSPQDVNLDKGFAISRIGDVIGTKIDTEKQKALRPCS